MEKELIEGIISGDTKKLTWIYQHYGPSLYGYVIKNGGLYSDAEDVFQITIIEVRKNLLAKKYTYQKQKFKHYFMKIGMNVWRNELRRRKKESFYSIDDKTYNIIDESEAALETIIVKNKKVALLRQALKMLGKQCRELINTHYFEGIKLVTIAEENGEKASKVRVQLLRCREQLKKLIQKKSNYPI